AEQRTDQHEAHIQHGSTEIAARRLEIRQLQSGCVDEIAGKNRSHLHPSPRLGRFRRRASSIENTLAQLKCACPVAQVLTDRVSRQMKERHKKVRTYACPCSGFEFPRKTFAFFIMIKPAIVEQLLHLYCHIVFSHSGSSSLHDDFIVDALPSLPLPMAA